MWQTKYIDNEFAYLFSTEQEYIDSAFIMIVMFNFGTWLNRDNLLDNLETWDDTEHDAITPFSPE